MKINRFDILEAHLWLERKVNIPNIKWNGKEYRTPLMEIGRNTY